MAWWIFQHVVTTALLATVVALVCRVTRMGPVARHALWVLVLIKFVTPPLVAWPWTMPDPLGLSGGHAAYMESAGLTDGVIPAEEITPFATAGAQDTLIQPVAADVAAWSWIVGLWVTGSILLAAVEGIRLWRLTRRTRAAAPATPELTNRVATLATRMGVAPVPIVLVGDARAPSVWGLIRPRILWPASLSDHVSAIGTEGLIVHELAHVKRRDHLVGWIELAGGILWWWNPLFWSVRAALREQAELACDAWVISALPDGRRAYAESLLALSSEGSHSVPSSIAVVGISTSTRRALERRLVMIMKGRTSLRLTFAGICSLAVVAAATLPTWAASPQGEQPPSAALATTPPLALTPPALPAPQATATETLRASSVPPTIQATPSQGPVVQRPRVQPPSRPAAPVVSGGRGMVNPRANLPEPARALAEAFTKDQQAYLEEMMQKTAARREIFTTQMQRLQEELTKAGNLDDAVAIRDYLRMAAPAGDRPAAGRGGRGSVAAPVTMGGRAGGGGR